MERAQRRKYHYIYKTTCIITNKFYIGMHSTDNLEDGYIGSGKRLWYSINKHGKDNHDCEILEFLPDRKTLKEREKQIVNVELINEELCMNLQLGGGGGISDDTHSLNLREGARVWLNNKWSNIDYSIRMKEILRNGSIKNHKSGNVKYDNFTGKSHSEETKRKIGESNSLKQKGSNNSQYGKCWITNEIESKKINKGDMIPEGWRLGRKII
jgi:hypothetical protein